MKTISWILLFSMIFFSVQCGDYFSGDLEVEVQPFRKIKTEISGTVRWKFKDHPTNRAFVHLNDYNPHAYSARPVAADTTDADGIYHIVYVQNESCCSGGFIDLRLEVRYGVIKTPKFSTEIKCSETPIELHIKI